MSDFDNNNQGGGDRPAYDTSKLGPIDDMKLRLYSVPAMGSTKRPSLSLKMYENNPRFVVKTNVDNDKDYGKITAAMDMPIFYMFLDVLRDIIDAPAPAEGSEPLTHRIVNKKRKFINNESKILDDTYTLVGKDPDGTIWISILAYDKDRPRVKFELVPGDYHSIIGKDRQPYPKGKLSQFFARGWLTLLQSIIPMVFVKDYTYVDYFAKKGPGGVRQQGGGGGGYQNRNNGGGGGGNSYGNNNGGGNNYGNQNRQQGGGGGGGSYQGNNNNGGAAKSAPPSDNWADDDDLVI